MADSEEGDVRELLAAQRLVNPQPTAKRYPGELLFAVTWALIVLGVTVWIIIAFVKPFILKESMRFNVLMSVLGIFAIMLAAYSLQIGWGAMRWTWRFNKTKNKDWFREWQHAYAADRAHRGQQGVRDWDDVQHFVVVTVYKESIEYMKSVAYTLMSQGRLPLDPSLETATPPCTPLASMAADGVSEATVVRRNFCQQHITLVFAMEQSAGEAEARAKADRLKEDLGQYFKGILDFYHPDPVLHPEREEIRGKASNFKWAVQELDEHIRRSSVDADNCIVHVADYDSLYDPNHFPFVTFDFCTRDDREFLVWQPCMMPTGNFWRIQPCVRQMTVTITAQEMMAAIDPLEFQIPFSTYGMPLTTLRHIGGGHAKDAQDGDVIAEDHHLFVKGFFATGGKLRVRPVVLPCFNFTEEGWECLSEGCQCCCRRCTSWDSRFTQAARHMFGIAELAYYCSLIFRGGCCRSRYRMGVKGSLRTMALGAKLIKVHGVAYLGLWVFLGIILQLLLKGLIFWCEEQRQRHQWHDICDTDVGEANKTVGNIVLTAGTSMALFGSILSSISFSRMLYSTQFRLEHIANPTGAFMGSQVFMGEARSRERLVPIGGGGPWLGVLLQLSIEQVVFGVVSSMLYGFIAAVVALQNLIRKGHRLKYVSSVGQR